MLNTYKPKYFSLKECFPKDVKACWSLMDDRIMMMADELREVFGPLWVNGRGLTQCGFRTNGSLTSQHRCGRALDLHSDKVPYFEIRKFILDNPDQFKYITFLEVDIDWLHIDCRDSNDVKIWSPQRWYLTKEEYLTTGDLNGPTN